MSARFPVVRILPLFVLSLTLVSCNSGQTDRRFSTGSGLGSKGGTTSPYGDKIQSFFEEGSNARIAELFVDPANLTDGQSFGLAGSYHTDTDDLASELGIKGNSISPMTTPTIVTATKPDAIKKPITIVIDLPKRSGSLWSLFLSSPNYFIVHTTYDPVKNRWVRGVVPLKDMKVYDDRIVLQTTRTGRYEVWHAEKPLSDYPKDSEIPPPDLVNAPIRITKISPLVANTGDTIIVKGKYLSRRTVLTVGDKATKYKLHGPHELSFIMPAQPFGYAVVAARGRNRLSRMHMISMADKKEYPLITLPAEDVCSNLTFYTIEGRALQGRKACGPTTCQSGGKSGCLATADYPAVAQASIDAKKFLNTATINGIQGEIEPPEALPPYCSATVATNCLTSTKFPSVSSKLMVAGNFRKGVSFPSLGITGSYPDNSKPLPGASGVFRLDSNNFSSALRDSTGIPFQYWDAYGNRHTLTGDTELKPENLREGRSVYGVKGIAKEGELPACSFAGDSNCRAHRYDFWAMAKDTLKPENIRKGKRIYNVVGAYPSTQFPLASASGTQLTSRNFDQMLTSGNAFVYYDAFGNRHTATGSPDFKAENIKEGITVFGVVGKLKSFQAGNIKPEHIRYGVKVGKITGNLKVSCRNMGPSIHDTVNFNGNTTHNPWGTDQYSCEDKKMVDVTPGGCGNGSANCVFKDNVTGLMWGGNSGRRYGTLSEAHSYCQDVRGGRKATGNFGGYTDWRLPTLQEILMASNHGLSEMLKGKSYFFPIDHKGRIWTSTAASHGYVLYDTRYGTHLISTKGKNQVMCVRDAK